MRPGNSISRYILFTIFALSVGFILKFILSSDIRQIIFLIPDDSSYYLKIAENFAAGKGFTFDGINQTNGFQPLWQYVLIGFVTIFGSTPESTLTAVLIFQVLIMCISSLIFYKLLRQYFDDFILLSVGICYILFVFFQSVNGMETPLLVLTIAILLYYGNAKKILIEHSVVNEFLFGLLFGLVILTRLDSIFFTIPVGIVCMVKFFKEKDKVYLSMLTCIASGVTVIILPYIIYNYVSFGNIIPISGYLKSSFPLISFTEKFTDILHYREMIFVLFAFCYLVWFCFTISKKVRHDYFQSMLAIMSAGILILFMYIVFFMNWVVFSWYFITYSLFVSLAVSIPSAYITGRKFAKAGTIAYMLILTTVSLFYGGKVYKYYTTSYKEVGTNWNVESYDAAQWAKDNTSPDEMFAMKDAGHFSYYSNRNVISLDGLVNNFEFQEVIKDKRINEYFRKNNVSRLVQHAVWNRPDVAEGNYDTLHMNYVSHKYSMESDPVIVSKKNEVYRSAPYYDGQYYVAFIIWNLNHKP